MNYGTVVGAVGDVDGDGLADIGVGAGVADYMGYTGDLPGSSVYSSATGLLQWSLPTTTVAELELLDDIDGDGVRDLALGGMLDPLG